MKKSLFKKSLSIYLLIIGAVCLAFLFHVYKVLKDYEYNQTGNFLRSSITSISDSDLKKYLSDNNLDETLLSNYKEMINSKDLVFKMGEEDVFNVTLNNRLLFKISTKVTGEKTRLGLFTYQIREVTDIEPVLKRGLYYYDIEIPSNFKIYLDGEEQKIDAVKETEYKSLDFMYKAGNMPKIATYEINNLTSEKQLVVKDFLGKEVELKQDGSKYSYPEYTIKKDDLEAAKEVISDIPDVLEIAKKWSLFLTRDLSGSYYGLYEVQKFLVKGTSIYQMAYNWSHGIDIMFTSKHRLENPPFSNEKLSDFVIYDENAFSCKVYLDKTMYVNGKPQVDTMNDYFYFEKINGEWKLVNVKAVEVDFDE